MVVVPVGALDGAKSRLGESLDPEERRDLVISLLQRTIAVLRDTPGLETLVVSPDPDVLAIATEAGVDTLRQRGMGLNQGLREAREVAVARGAPAIVVLPVDLPLLSTSALNSLLRPLHTGAAARRPTIVIVPDRSRRGTNALAIAPPDAIEFCFGGDSRAAHLASARSVGADVVELDDGPLTLDLDTPDDLLLVEELAPEAVGAR
jgi:2-phospho-L-lactate guanylyltransferase